MTQAADMGVTEEMLNDLLGPVKTPTCEIVITIDGTDVRCDRPSVTRVLLHCLGCERERRMFLCAEHYDELARQNKGKCVNCHPGTVYTITEI